MLHILEQREHRFCLNVEYGVFYVFDEASSQLTPTGGYGVQLEQLQTMTIQDGLVGQCAKRRT
ncbi:MAG: hypothetical protein WCI39_06195 [Gallionellaceae bacterium]